MDVLPDEIISSILEHLDPVTRLRTALVNKRFLEIATDPMLHRFATFKSSFYLPESLITMYIKKFGESLRYLDLQDCYWLKLSNVSVIHQYCTSLTYLNLLSCLEIPVNMVLLIFRHNANLQHFGWTVGLDLLSKLKNIHSGQGQHAIEQINGISVLFENLVSLKLGLQVYSAVAYRDVFEPETALFTHMISRIISPKLQKLYVICLERGQLMQQPKLSRVLLEIHIELKQLDQSLSLCGIDMKNYFTKTRNDLTITAMLEHDGIIKGWLRYVLAKKNYTVRAIAVSGPPFLNFWIPLLGNGLKSCELTEIQSLDISSSHDVPIYWMSSVLKVNSLRVLNLSNMECVSGNLLQVISEGSPYLESINLQGCHECLEPISGLKSIATKCPHLRHLNLGRIHYHTSTLNNELLEILSSMKYLISLSLSGCSVMPLQLSTEKQVEVQSNQAGLDVRESEKKAGKPSSVYDSISLPRYCFSSSNNSVSSSNNSVSSSNDSLTSSNESLSLSNGSLSPSSHSDVSNTDEEFESCQGQIEENHTLQSFIYSCSFLQQIEIIGVGFHSVLRKGWPISRPPPERAHLIWDCPDQESEFLEALAYCKCLQKLTLAGLDIRGGLEFLVKITSSCQRLHFLSLAQLRGLETSIALPTLTRALANCHSLKQLRFEQSYFAVPESFTMALFSSVSLESLCIITKGGSIAVSTILPLFEKCRKLRVLQICADASSSEETFRNITSILNNRYSSERPGLALCLFPYDSNTRDLHDKLFNHANEQSFPLVHLKNLSLFGSEVAPSCY